MTVEDKRKFKPNGKMHQCQCVMNHFTHIDGDIAQCQDMRDVQNSNLYCTLCEETHGDALSRKTVTA